MSHSADIPDNQAVLMLNDHGVIRECNQACEKLFGYLSAEILRRHISTLLPQLAGIAPMRGKQINPRLRFLTHIGHHFEAVGPGGVHFASQLFISEVETLGQQYLRLIIRPA